jgi:hypothetical protein
MTRAATGDVVEVPPTNNVYTVLAGIAFLTCLIAVIVVWVKAGDIFPGGLMGQ